MDRKTFALSFFASSAVLGLVWGRLVDPLETTDPTAYLLGSLVMCVLGYGVWILLARQRLRHAGQPLSMAWIMLAPLANILFFLALLIMDKDGGQQRTAVAPTIDPAH